VRGKGALKSGAHQGAGQPRSADRRGDAAGLLLLLDVRLDRFSRDAGSKPTPSQLLPEGRQESGFREECAPHGHAPIVKGQQSGGRIEQVRAHRPSARATAQSPHRLEEGRDRLLEHGQKQVHAISEVDVEGAVRAADLARDASRGRGGQPLRLQHARRGLDDAPAGVGCLLVPCPVPTVGHVDERTLSADIAPERVWTGVHTISMNDCSPAWPRR
jgi:hypothetical protein